MATPITFTSKDKKITLTGGSGKVKFLTDLENPDFRNWLDVTTKELKNQLKYSDYDLNMDSLENQKIMDYANECYDNLPWKYRISTSPDQCENALQSCIKLFQFVELVKVLYAHGEEKYVEKLSGFKDVQKALIKYENNQSDGGNPYDGTGGMVNFFKLNDKNNSNPVKEYLSKHMSKFFTQRDKNGEIIGGERFFEDPTAWMGKHASEYNQEGYTSGETELSNRSYSTSSRSDSTASSDSLFTCIGPDYDRYSFLSARGTEELDSPSNLRDSVAGLKQAMEKSSQRYQEITNQNVFGLDDKEEIKNNIMAISDGPTRRLLIEQFTLLTKATEDMEEWNEQQDNEPENVKIVTKLSNTMLQSIGAFTGALDKNSPNIPPSSMGRICRWLSDLIDKVLGKTFSKLDKKTYDMENLENRLEALSKRIQAMDENLSNNRNSLQGPSN